MAKDPVPEADPGTETRAAGKGRSDAGGPTPPGGPEREPLGGPPRTRLYVGLVHQPVYDKHRRVIASAVTTVDLHDIARAAKTYGVSRFFVITPLTDQRRLAQRVVEHWTEGYGAGYNPDRKAAMEIIRVMSSLPHAEASIAEQEGESPLLMATDAAPDGFRTVSYEEAGGIVASGRPVLLLLGTAWGLERGVLERSHLVLEPVAGTGEYNHLSVRSAAAIILDRLLGRRVERR